MKIAFVLGTLGLGGHTRSAVAIGRALQEIGHDIHVFGIDQGGTNIVLHGGLPLTTAPRSTGIFNCLHKSEKQAFVSFFNEFRPDVIHCFDYRALPLIKQYCGDNPIPVIWTICGGPVPHHTIPDMRPIVVFSEELRQGLHQHHRIPEEHLFINAARVELRKEIYRTAEERAFRTRHSLGELPIVLLISRIANTKLNAILHTIDAFETMGNSAHARLLIVGKVDSDVAFRKVKSAAEKTNSLLGESMVTVTSDGSEHASRLIPMSNIAIGVGRTAFESMYHGVPTLVIGEHGLSGVATSDTASRMSVCNFSGRDARALPASVRTPQATAKELQHLLIDPDYARTVGEDGRQWVEGHLDSRKGAQFYDALYCCPEDFFLQPTQHSLRRLQRSFALRDLYHLLFPTRINNLVVLLRKRFGAI